MVKTFHLKFYHEKITTDENSVACFKIMCTLDNKKLDPIRLLYKKMVNVKGKVNSLRFE